MGASTNIGTMRFCPTPNSNTSGLCYYINRPYVRGTTVAPLDKVPFSMVRNPSKFMLFVDVDTEAPGTNGFALIGPGGLASHVTPLFSIPQKDRHSGRANMVFGDGHVQAVTQADILAFGDTWTRIDN